MRISLVLSLLLGGCLLGGTINPPNNGGGDMAGGGGGGADMTGGGGGTDDMGGGGGPSDLAGLPTMDVMGPIAANATWNNVINLKATTTINAGVTVTVAAGSLISAASGASLIVNGTLKVQGTAAQGVKLEPATTSSWGGILAKSGGSVDLAYASITNTVVPLGCEAGATLCKADHVAISKFTGYGMDIKSAATLSYVKVEQGGSDGIYASTVAGQTVSISDSTFRTTGGDALVLNGAGNFTITHNTVSAVVAGTTGQHCACHFDATGTYNVTFNTFDSSTVGFMASKMAAASVVNNNNFISNTYSASETGVGVNAGVDLKNNYWGGGPPPAILGNSNTMPYSTTPIAGTGPR